MGELCSKTKKVEKSRGDEQYRVSLDLTKFDGDGFPNFICGGSGLTEYEAIVEASKVALRDFSVEARKVEDCIKQDDDEKGKFHMVKDEIKSQTKKLMKILNGVDEEYRDEIDQLKLKVNYLEETVDKLNKQVIKKDLKIRELQCKDTKLEKQKATGVES